MACLNIWGSIIMLPNQLFIDIMLKLFVFIQYFYCVFSGFKLFFRVCYLADIKLQHNAILKFMCYMHVHVYVDRNLDVQKLAARPINIIISSTVSQTTLYQYLELRQLHDYSVAIT